LAPARLGRLLAVQTGTCPCYINSRVCANMAGLQRLSNSRKEFLCFSTAIIILRIFIHIPFCVHEYLAVYSAFQESRSVFNIPFVFVT
jgi:hypothetical protein